MSDNTMPERIIAGYGFHGYEWSLPESVMAYRLESVTEYIRADVAAAQLDAANARIAELEAAQAWVSVDERLPEPLVDVLVTDGESITTGWASKNGGWSANGWSYEAVTHWMPLPPPPVTDVTP